MISSSAETLDNFTCADEPRYRDFRRQHRPHVALVGMGVNVSWDCLQEPASKQTLHNLFVLCGTWQAGIPQADARVFAWLVAKCNVIHTSHDCV